MTRHRKNNMRSRSNIKFLFLFLICPAFLFNSTGLRSYPNNNIQVMSFNIRYNSPSDGKNAWPNRKQMVAQTIRFHKVDIIGVQEALYNQILDLQSLLPEYDWRGVGRDDGQKKGEFTPIFYKKDCFHVIQTGNFWLSEDPDRPGSRDWDAACPRLVTWIEFKDKTVELFFISLILILITWARKHEQTALS